MKQTKCPSCREIYSFDKHTGVHVCPVCKKYFKIEQRKIYLPYNKRCDKHKFVVIRKSLLLKCKICDITISLNLQNLRKAYNLTQKQLAERIGMSQVKNISE